MSVFATRKRKYENMKIDSIQCSEMSERRVAPIRRVAPKRVANLGSPPSSPNRSPETVQASIIEVPAAITSTSTPSPILPPTEQGQPGPSNPIPDVGSSTSPFSSQRARASPASIVKRAAPPSNRGLVRTREDGQRDVKKTTSCTSLPRTITELSHKSSFCYKKQSSLIPLEDALRDVRHSSLESKAERRAKFSAHTVSLEREDLTVWTHLSRISLESLSLTNLSLH